MRIDIPKFCIFFLFVVSLFWFIPHFYEKIARSDRFSLNGLYSPIKDQFIIWEMSSDKITYIDENATILSKSEAQKSLPLFFVSSTNKWGNFPLTIKGETFTYKEALENVEGIKLSPRVISKKQPPLHILFDSVPDDVSFELPSDVVSIQKDSLYFIQTKDGKIDVNKSQEFTQALKGAGLTFPVRIAAVNPSPLKSYDEGLVLVDDKDKIFSLRQQDQKPIVKIFDIDLPEKPIYILINEQKRREFYNIIITSKGFYLNTQNKGLIKLPLEEYSPTKDSIYFRSTALSQSVIDYDVREKNLPVKYLALNRDYNLIHKYTKEVPEHIVKRDNRVESAISVLTPFIIKQYTTSKSGVLFHITPSKNIPLILLGIFLSLLVYLIYQKRKGAKIDNISCLLIVLTGLPGLMSILLLGSLKKIKN